MPNPTPRPEPRSPAAAGRLLACLIAMLLLAAPTLARAATLRFHHAAYTTLTATPFAQPLRVIVRDDAGQPAAGVAVRFSTVRRTSAGYGSDNGADARLSTTVAVTDDDGIAEIAATANDIAGYYLLRADALDVAVGALLVNRPVGYRPGEALPKLKLFDQDDRKLDLRAAVGNRNFVLIDVCAGFCAPCVFLGREAEKAIAILARDHGIALRFETLMQVNGPADPSSREHAELWRARTGQTGPVFHSEGSFQSEAFGAGNYFTVSGGPGALSAGAYPTSLLVGPDGVIVDRIVGAMDASQLVRRVLSAGSQPRARRHPQPVHPRDVVDPVAELRLELPSGEVIEEAFEASGSAADGALSYTRDTSDPALVRHTISYRTLDVGIPLPGTGTIGLRLTRLDDGAPGDPLLGTTASLRLQSEFLFEDETGNGSLHRVEVDGLTVPVTRLDARSSALAVDLVALRATLLDRARAGQYTVLLGSPPMPGETLAAAIADGLYRIDATLAFARHGN